MSAIDFKKTQKELYSPKTEPSIIEVPEMKFIMIDGRGNPNDTDGEYTAAVQILYGLSYAIKMGNKATLEYVVPPLEGLWTVDDPSFRGGGAAIKDKKLLIWTMMLRQPDFVTQDIFEDAKASLKKKKPELDTGLARLEQWTEGVCAQVLHIGSYDDEPSTIKRLDDFINQAGYYSDMAQNRRHHEIYISDPRKTEPIKLKTVIRHPIVKSKEI